MNKFLTSTILGALLLGIGVPALAEYTPKKADLGCMKAAVGKRENSIVAAKAESFTALNATYAARRDALKAAWDKTDAKARRDAINDAWSKYRTSHKEVRAELRKDLGTAWSIFQTDRKACRVDSGSNASENAGLRIDAETL
jgi:hypothetical protein